ncbi:MAG: ribonuclease HII [Coriobacteriia bacterium]
MPVARCREVLRATADADLSRVIESFADDPRAGVRDAVSVARARMRRLDAEHDRLRGLAAFQRGLHSSGLAVVAGVDEVGRGALAGPVTAAAVVLPVDTLVLRLDDSKRLDPKTRREVAAQVREHSSAWRVAHVEAREIDRLGIAEATRKAMRDAVAALGIRVDHVIVDGNDPPAGLTCTAIVGADARVACVAAASVVAKVARDELMVSFDAEYPGYGLAAHKGYGTVEHLEAIARLGITPLHRRSFGPCSQVPLF